MMPTGKKVDRCYCIGMFDSFHGAGGNSHLDPVHPRTGTGGNDDPVRSESVGIAPIQICAEPHIDAQAIDFRLMPTSVIADPLMPGSQRRDPHLAARSEEHTSELKSLMRIAH